MASQWLAFVLCWQLAHHSLWATPWEPIHHERQSWRLLSFTKDAGLTGKNIFQIDFQRGGTSSKLERIWLATSGGLLEYDGYSWRQHGVAQGLPSDFVRCVLVTRRGDLWIGTDQGAGIYDGKSFRMLAPPSQLAGPSVRRIAEDVDGTLWFCSDPWPSSARRGGLTSLRNGQWTRFTTIDGLPSEYVVNYFRDSSNRQWVVTKDGVARWSGSNWVTALKPAPGRDGFSSGCFAEVPGRPAMFSAGLDVYLYLSNSWVLQPISRTFPHHQHGIFATTDGKLLSCQSKGPGRKTVSEWDGTGWSSLSAEFDLPRGYNEDIREDPDGNIWVLGFETVVCWKRRSQWDLLHNVPPPRFLEQSNGIWFNHARLGVLPPTLAIRLDHGHWDRMESTYDDLSPDETGGVWGWSSNQVTHWVGTQATQFTKSDTGLQVVEAGRSTPDGAYWLVGLNPSGQVAAARFHDGHWSLPSVPNLQGDISKSGIAVSRDELWMILQPTPRTNAFVLRLGSHSTGTIDVPRNFLSEFHYGLHVAADGSELWLYGDNGLYRRKTAGKSWESVTNIPGMTVIGIVERGDELWVGCTGATGGRIGVARYRNGEWTTFPVRSLINISLAPDRTVLMGGKGYVTLVENSRDATPLEIELPENIRADGVVKDYAGDYWIGNEESLLHFRTDRIPPRTRITGGVTNMLQGGRLTINVDAVERFSPLGRRADHAFSWRMDDQAWSPFVQNLDRQISIPAPALGEHSIDVRARDAGGDIESSPAVFRFTVHPLPLQSRPWFLWAGAAVILLLSSMAAIAIHARSELASYAQTLEYKVLERTAALKADLIVRQRTEAALRESEERWQFALEGSGDGLWDWNAQTNQVHFSSRWKSMLGYADHEISDRLEEWDKRMHPEDKSRVYEKLQAHLDSKTPYYVSEHRLLCKDGTYKWILDRGRVLTRNAEGRPIRVIGTHCDISERKRVETELLESEQRMKATLDTLLQGCAIIGFDWTYIYVNQIAATHARRTCEELLGQKLTDLYPNVEQTPLYSVLKHSMVERVPQRMEHVFLYPDGSSAILDLEIRPVADGVFVQSIDVTAQRKAEQERERLVLLVEHSADFIATSDLTGQVTYLNPAGRRMIGFGDTEPIHKLHFTDYVPEPWRPYFVEKVIRSAREEGIWEGEMQLVNLQTKQLIDVLRSVFLVRNPETGEPLGFATVTRDISARKAVETALRESEERFAKAFQANPSILAISTYTEGKYVDVNQAFTEVLGFTRSEVLGKTALDLGVWFLPSQRQAIFKCIQERQLVRSVECQLRSKAGQILTVLASVERIELGGQPCLLFINHDITERKESEKIVKETQVRFQQLAENIREVFWLSNAEKSQMLYVSPGYERIWGRPCESLYHSPNSWIESIHAEDRKSVAESLRQRAFEGTYDLEYRILRPDGSVRWIHDRAFPVRDDRGCLYRIAGIAEDITERRKLETQFRQAQKMDALGTLSGGIAHDFNNILGAIFGNVALAKLELEQSHPASSMLAEIKKAADRARDLVHQILAFSRQQPQTRKNIQLEPIIQEAIGLLRASLPAGIELSKSLDPNTPSVLADGTQIHQILLNLCTNAWHAIGDVPGRIEIRLQPVEVKPDDRIAGPDLHQGFYACLSVIDSGQGMDALTLERIFEPFFTTKEPGRGTGLGLSVVHGIMQSHDGVIRVSSQLGRGTSFHLYFPAAPTETDSTLLPSRSLRKGSGERILYLDDEVPLVDVAIKTLRRLAYEPHGYTRADAALKAIEKDPGFYQLIITDLHMPEMSGIEFIQAVRKIHPTIPIILSSGHITESVASRIRQMGVVRMILKPNTMDDLSESVHEVLKSRITHF